MIKNFLIGAIALLLLVVVQSPFSYSMECSQVSQPNYDTCVQIKNMNLTDSEKDLIISNLDYSNKFFPDHDYIYDRNTNLVINSAPSGIQSQNGIFVKNAWMSIFTPMPSVIYNNSLFVHNQTKLLTGFNYQLQTPINYYSSGYPNTDQGDCQRFYTQTKNSAENKIYVNGNYQGSGKLVDLNINQDSEIKSIYNVNVAYSVDHYYWQRYCSRYGSGYCQQYSYRCAFSYNNIQQDNIQIEDKINVSYYNNSLYADLNTLSSYSDNYKFNLNFSNSVKTIFQDSSYIFNEFIYSINYSKAPYYVLTLIAEDYHQEQINNLFKQENNLIVKNTNNCTIEAFDLFSYLNKSCFSEEKPVNFRIETDKLIYKPNETIKVFTYPQNISVNISYGNQSKIIIGNTIFLAQALQNKIIAFNENSKAERIIYVQEQDRFGIIWKFSIFGFLNYLLYAILKKCFGGLV